MKKKHFLLLFFSFTILSFSQDLLGTWENVALQTDATYDEFTLTSFENGYYDGTSEDGDITGGMCNFKIRAAFNPETMFFRANEYELIELRGSHVACVFDLYYREEVGLQILEGKTRLKERNGSLSPPSFVKFVKRKPIIEETPKKDSIIIAKKTAVKKSKSLKKTTPKSVKKPIAKTSTKKVIKTLPKKPDSLVVIKKPKTIKPKVGVKKSAIKKDSVIVKKTTPKVKKPKVMVKTPVKVQPKIIKKDIPKVVVLEKPKKISIEEDIEIFKNYRTQRINKKLADINVKTSTIKLKVFDYGQVDNDSITIFYNNKMIAHRIAIDKSIEELDIELDQTAKEHKLYFIANNEGKIPPNTARIELYIENKKYEYDLFTDVKSNALIQFYPIWDIKKTMK